MTQAERAHMKNTLVSFMHTHPVGSMPQKILSPYTHGFFMMAMRGCALALIFAIVGGGSLALASEQALPGGSLYDVKVHVVEPIRGALTLSTSAKLDWEAQRVERRIAEIQTLKDADALTEERATIAETELSAQTETFKTNLDAAIASGDREAAANASAKVLAVLSSNMAQDTTAAATTVETPATARTMMATVNEKMPARELSGQERIANTILKENADVRATVEKAGITVPEVSKRDIQEFKNMKDARKATRIGNVKSQASTNLQKSTDSRDSKDDQTTTESQKSEDNTAASSTGASTDTSGADETNSVSDNTVKTDTGTTSTDTAVQSVLKDAVNQSAQVGASVGIK